MELEHPCSLSSDWRQGSGLTNGPGATSLTRASLYNPLEHFQHTIVMLPKDQHRSLLGGHHWGHFLTLGHVFLMWNHMAKYSFWTTSMNANPWWSGSHSKKLSICRSIVGPWKESSVNPIFSDVSSPKPTFRSPELKASHSPHLRPLCRGGFRAGISERLKLESGRENRRTCSSAFQLPWVKCLRLPRLSVN